MPIGLSKNLAKDDTPVIETPNALDIDPYQEEQRDAWEMIVAHLDRLPVDDRTRLREACADYLAFREETGRFLDDRFSEICTRNCYNNQLSACCTRDGIITFFGDLVVNALVSSAGDLERIRTRLAASRPDAVKCLYLAPDGCLWRLKPLVCEMFLCDAAMTSAFRDDCESEACWKALKSRAQTFRYPDRPVLFDQLEMAFLAAGFRSSLMYINTSPALRRIKSRAGLPMAV